MLTIEQVMNDAKHVERFHGGYVCRFDPYCGPILGSSCDSADSHGPTCLLRDPAERALAGVVHKTVG